MTFDYIHKLDHSGFNYGTYIRTGFHFDNSTNKEENYDSINFTWRKTCF